MTQHVEEVYLTVPNPMKTAEADAAVNMIMVALVAAATSGSTPISSMSGPCHHAIPPSIGGVIP